MVLSDGDEMFLLSRELMGSESELLASLLSAPTLEWDMRLQQNLKQDAAIEYEWESSTLQFMVTITDNLETRGEV